MTVLTMIDTIHDNVHNIPANAPYVAGYDTGSADIKWTAQDWARFSKDTVRIHIDQSPSLLSYATGASHLADIETGAGTIQAFISTSRARLAKSATLYPRAYVSRGNHVAGTGAFYDLLRAIVANHIDPASCGFWLADWSLNATEAAALIGLYDPGHGLPKVNVRAVQWASPTTNPRTLVPGSGLTLAQANCDLSEVAAGWLGNPPVVPPVQTVSGLLVRTDTLTVTHVTSTDAGKTWK